MTLGRALQELGQHAEARAEFEYVLSLAPDNLAAIRGLAELHGEEVDAVPAFAAPPPEPAAAPAPPPERIAPPVAPSVEMRADLRNDMSEPDFAALDASIAQADAASVADAERAAQIERLEIWLARMQEERDAGGDRSA